MATAPGNIANVAAAPPAIDARVKVIYVAWVFLTASIVAHPLLLSLLFLVTVAVALASPVPFADLVRAGKLGWFVAGVSWVLWILFLRHHGEVLASAGAMGITLPGVMNGLSVAARIGAILLSFLVVFQSTPTRAVMTALHRLHVSVPVAMVIGITLRLIPQIQAEHKIIMEAQRSRGVAFDKGNILARLRKHTAYIIPLVLRALKITSDLSLAMEARAFDPYAPRTFSVRLEFRWFDWMLLAIMAVSLSAIIAARMAGYAGMPSQWLAS